jgi:hypothetical protein
MDAFNTPITEEELRYRSVWLEKYKRRFIEELRLNLDMRFVSTNFLFTYLEPDETYCNNWLYDLKDWLTSQGYRVEDCGLGLLQIYFKYKQTI